MQEPASFEPKCILIIGIGGGLAQITAKLIHKAYPQAKIVGVDSRKNVPKSPNDKVHYQSMRYSRGNFEKLFREHQFDVVYHLGRISHAGSGSQSTLARRLDLNVMGTSRILNLCLKHEIKKIVILSTFHVYGALPDNPVYLSEDAILKASIKYPDLRDVVEMDQIATNWMWKHQNNIQTVVLRPCNIIGSQIKNAMSQYLSSPWTPLPIDFNPMFQFIHEFDMANVLTQAIEFLSTGIYNVAPNEFISIRDAREAVGIKGVPSSLFLLGHLARFVKRIDPKIPDYLVDYLKYSALIDPSEIQLFWAKDFCRFSIKDTLQLLKLT